MESFWGSLKNELVHHRRFDTRREAEADIRVYIEIFYNRQRRHSRLGYLAPAVFAQNFRQITRGCLKRQCPVSTGHLRFLDTGLGGCLPRSFVFSWEQITSCRMQTLLVVKHGDVIRNVPKDTSLLRR